MVETTGTIFRFTEKIHDARVEVTYRSPVKNKKNDRLCVQQAASWKTVLYVVTLCYTAGHKGLLHTNHQVEPAVDDAAIREQLGRLLTSAPFRTSKRCQGLLRYVVEAYLENHFDRVKERTIGFEVFQRDPNYDTNQDSVVRTTAAEIRKKLAQYYQEPEHRGEVRVLLPQGSYLPEFRPAAAVAPAAQPVSPTLEEKLPVAAGTSATRERLIGMAIALAVVAIAGLVYGFSRPRANELSLFWKPLLEDSSSAVICVGQPLRVYIFEGNRTADLNEKMVGTLTTPPASPEIREQTTITLSELRSAGDRYYSVGDYLASVRLAEFLGQRAKPFQIIGDRSAALKDLRGRPAVLIGQFNNLWTMGLTGNLRYYIDRSTHFSYDVLDRQNPGKVIFSAVRNASRPEEYAIVSRIFDAPTEKTVVAIAGMTFNGTTAAGEFLTNERYMQEAFGRAPSGWNQKNIQVILKTTMMGGATGPPKVVATYFW